MAPVNAHETAAAVPRKGSPSLCNAPKIHGNSGNQPASPHHCDAPPSSGVQRLMTYPWAPMYSYSAESQRSQVEALNG